MRSSVRGSCVLNERKTQPRKLNYGSGAMPVDRHTIICELQMSFTPSALKAASETGQWIANPAQVSFPFSKNVLNTLCLYRHDRSVSNTASVLRDGLCFKTSMLPLGKYSNRFGDSTEGWSSSSGM